MHFCSVMTGCMYTLNTSASGTWFKQLTWQWTTFRWAFSFNSRLFFTDRPQSAIDRAQLSEMSIQSVLLVSNFFSSIKRFNAWIQVLSLASRSWAGVSLESEVLVPDEKFSYEEQERPEEFFLPYLWTVVYDSSGIKWSPNRIRLFSVTEHEVFVFVFWFHTTHIEPFSVA